MANFIANANLGPEYVESSLKALLTPSASFVATLTAGGATNVDIVGPTGTVYVSFVLDTLNQAVDTGVLVNLPATLRYTTTSGTGIFNIRINVGA